MLARQVLALGAPYPARLKRISKVLAIVLSGPPDETIDRTGSSPVMARLAGNSGVTRLQDVGADASGLPAVWSYLLGLA